REHPSGRPAKPDPGATRWQTFRPSGRAASSGGVQATGRGNHRRIRRAGPPALTTPRILLRPPWRGDGGRVSEGRKNLSRMTYLPTLWQAERAANRLTVAGSLWGGEGRMSGTRRH